ncbi:uncharacterized mitochondrial protein AtMg00810-like [Rutidosis leptorrhynchoides]|uniref:uncharacterized mitochondrial protein AtMg00810-like n=1 Tax=Rutidosis leptorrhynchoides TaxID=125765 RepID=UPI003A997BE2
MGFKDLSQPNHVCLLKRSLYVLKQASRSWYLRFTDFVYNLGFFHSKCDHSLLFYNNGPNVAYLLLYVDDIILVTSSYALRDVLMSKLAHEFAMKDLGPLSAFLGKFVSRTSDGLFLNQSDYANDIIQRAGMVSCNPAATHVDTHGKQSKSEGSLYPDPTFYRSLTGALQYLTFTRSDIAYAVQQVCLHMHAPRDSHMLALKRNICYVQGTISLGLHISKSNSTKIISYTDADWAGFPDTRRSTSGYCVYLGDNLISWSCPLFLVQVQKLNTGGS